MHFAIGNQVRWGPSLKEQFLSRASWRFSARTFALKPGGAFSNGRWVEDLVRELSCRGHALRGCSRRSFLLRRHPYPSLRESACLLAIVQLPSGFDTEDPAATVSRTLAVSIRNTLGIRRRVYRKVQTGLTSARASSSKEEGPMQPSFATHPSSLGFQDARCPRLLYNGFTW
jgi:hypothetical protein